MTNLTLRPLAGGIVRQSVAMLRKVGREDRLHLEQSSARWDRCGLERVSMGLVSRGANINAVITQILAYCDSFRLILMDTLP